MHSVESEAFKTPPDEDCSGTDSSALASSASWLAAHQPPAHLMILLAPAGVLPSWFLLAQDVADGAA